jgi:hypothetical protein
MNTKSEATRTLSGVGLGRPKARESDMTRWKMQPGQQGQKRALQQDQGNTQQPPTKKRRQGVAPPPAAPVLGMGGLQLAVGGQYRFVQFLHNLTDDTVDFADHTGQLTQINGTLCVFSVGPAGMITVPAQDVISAVPPLTWPVLQLNIAPFTCKIIAMAQQEGLVAKAATYGISFNQLLSMVIELDLTQNADDDEIYQAIVLGSVSALAPDMHTPSCYNAANVLYNLLAANPLPNLPDSIGTLMPASINGASSAAGFQGREKPTGNDPHFTNNLTLACTGLCTALTAAAGGNASWVFGVNFGIHGFVIAVTGQTAELLQSFAGDGGEMLMGFLEGTLKYGRSYSIAQLTSLLQEMIVEGAEDSDPGALRAQSIFFGGHADDPNDGGLTEAPLRWVACQMKADAAINQALIAWIRAGIGFYDDVKTAKDRLAQ